MFIKKRGLAKIKWFAKKASTAIALGDALTFDGLGYVTVAVAGSTSIVGFSKQVISATDSDYAGTKMIPVEIVDVIDELEVDVTTTMTQAMVGTYRELSTASTLNTAIAGTANQFRVIGLGSTSLKAIVSIAKNSLIS